MSIDAHSSSCWNGEMETFRLFHIAVSSYVYGSVCGYDTAGILRIGIPAPVF
jgi:hypothetical protein